MDACRVLKLGISYATAFETILLRPGTYQGNAVLCRQPMQVSCVIVSIRIHSAFALECSWRQAEPPPPPLPRMEHFQTLKETERHDAGHGRVGDKSDSLRGVSQRKCFQRAMFVCFRCRTLTLWI